MHGFSCTVSCCHYGQRRVQVLTWLQLQRMNNQGLQISLVTVLKENCNSIKKKRSITFVVSIFSLKCIFFFPKNSRMHICIFANPTHIISYWFSFSKLYCKYMDNRNTYNIPPFSHRTSGFFEGS